MTYDDSGPTKQIIPVLSSFALYNYSSFALPPTVQYLDLETNNQDDYYQYHVVPVYTDAVGANAATASALRSCPVFKHAPVWLVGTNELAQSQIDEMLGLGIPALSPSTGRTQIKTSLIPESRQKNLNGDEEFKPNGWPTTGHASPFVDRWLHNDMKDVAYYFNYKLFDTIVERGGLK